MTESRELICPEQINVVRSVRGGGYTVTQGDRYQDELTQDEALWCVVQFLMNGACGYLRTADEHEAQRQMFDRWRIERDQDAKKVESIVEGILDLKKQEVAQSRD